MHTIDVVSSRRRFYVFRIDTFLISISDNVNRSLSLSVLTRLFSVICVFYFCLLINVWQIFRPIELRQHITNIRLIPYYHTVLKELIKSQYAFYICKELENVQRLYSFYSLLRALGEESVYTAILNQ